VLDTGLQ